MGTPFAFKSTNKMPNNIYALSVVFIQIVSVLGDKEIYGDIFQESRSLSLAVDNKFKTHYGQKCYKEVPAIFFQTAKDEPVRGNGSTIHTNRIEVCCEGFSRSPYHWHECLADCSAVSSNNCRNGFCRLPNHCECFEGFVANDRGECVHTCPIACENGRCYLDGTCECNAGYTLDPQTRQFCRADCPNACGLHQECVAPGTCACKDGYKYVPDMGCQPVCTPDCGHGKCVGPNRCECFPSFSKRPQRNVCEAECFLTCENGFCETRFMCHCRDGYKYDRNTTSCIPDCGSNCSNGVCIAPGICKCFEGYELVGSSCEPICQGGCGFYGKCVEPNICGCGPSRQLCMLGHCDGGGHCICANGLTRFVNKCVDPLQLEGLVSSHDQRSYYNRHFKQKFDSLIGRVFQFSL